VSGYGRSDDKPAWFDLQLTANPHPDLPGVLVTCHEVGDRRRLEEELSHRAGHDALTGLGNRKTFDAALESLAAVEGPIAVMVIDLDHFKPLNDALGHDAGDAALRAVAECLTDTVRASDIVCRLGGDEFAVIMSSGDPASATALAHRVIAKIRDAWPHMDSSVALDSSIGIAVAHGPVPDPERLVRDADSAMYRAKQAGGGQSVTVTSETQDPDFAQRAVRADTSEDRPSPAPASPDSSVKGAVAAPLRTQRLLTSRVHGLMMWAFTLVVAALLLVLGLTYTQSVAAQLEHDRINDRLELVTGINELSASAMDTSRLIPVVASTPWDLDNPQLMEYILDEYANSTKLSPDGIAVMLDREGRVIAASPPGTSVALDVGGTLWAEALQGRAYRAPIVDDGERSRAYFVVPVATTDPIEHVLVLGADPRTTDWSTGMANLGSLTDAPGGISIVDVNGTASVSWTPDLIGNRVIDPALLPNSDTHDPRVERVDVDGTETVVIAVPIRGTHSPAFGVWTQSASTMFADLRTGQGARDLTIGAIVLLALIGLTFVSRRQEAALIRSEQRLDALLHNAHDIVVVLSASGTIRFASAAATHHLGVDRTVVAGKSADSLFGEEAARRIDEAISSLNENRGTTLTAVGVDRGDGSGGWFDIEVSDLRHHASIGGYLLTCHEVTERMELEALLTQQATRDPLTGLLNRGQFNTHLDQASRRRVTHAGSDAVVFIDLDHFKPINDTFGHQAGDELLRVIAQRITAAVRSHDLVCRLGGDEFALLLTDCDLDLARATVERLLDAIREPIPLAEGVAQIDASVGVAMSRSEVTNTEQLVREADQAMYEAKRSGRGRYVVEA
jgi:diguanylate cyclase (GGDEF)-like protein/PAS domain S-box-containing protein